MLLSGEKKLAYFPGTLPPTLPVNASVRKTETGYLVYLDEEGSKLADEWENVSNRYESGSMTIQEAHAKRGNLLGYSQELIDLYLSRRGTEKLV